MGRGLAGVCRKGTGTPAKPRDHPLRATAPRRGRDRQARLRPTALALCARCDRRSQHVGQRCGRLSCRPCTERGLPGRTEGPALRSGAQPTPGPAPGAAPSPADGPQVHPLPPPRPQWLPSFRGFLRDILARPHVRSLPPAVRPGRPPMAPTCLHHTGPAACPSPRTANSLLPGQTRPTRARHLLCQQSRPSACFLPHSPLPDRPLPITSGSLCSPS